MAIKKKTNRIDSLADEALEFGNKMRSLVKKHDGLGPKAVNELINTYDHFLRSIKKA